MLGQGRLIGVGNGDPNSHEADKAAFRTTFNGWAQAPYPDPQVSGIDPAASTGRRPRSATVDFTVR
ncbi:hypothetical protein ACRAWD_00815 [Caulobacter segnis]